MTIGDSGVSHPCIPGGFDDSRHPVILVETSRLGDRIAHLPDQLGSTIDIRHSTRSNKLALTSNTRSRFGAEIESPSANAVSNIPRAGHVIIKPTEILNITFGIDARKRMITKILASFGYKEGVLTSTLFARRNHVIQIIMAAGTTSNTADSTVFWSHL